MRMLKYIALAFAVTLASVALNPAAARAQTPCGSVSDAQERLTDFAEYFRDQEYADLRTNAGISQLTPSDPQYVVSDSTVCQRVYSTAVAQLQSHGTTTINLSAGAHDFVVLRYGPYYAIQLLNLHSQTLSSPPVIVAGKNLLLVYSRSTMQYLFGLVM
jgi:hypothetical protein